LNKFALLTLGGLLFAGTGIAYGDIIIGGSGASGNLDAAGGPWAFNFDGGAATTGYLNDWGSPGVDASVTPYADSTTAFGLEITFTGGGTLDSAAVDIGNGAACTGSTAGGTTFCTLSPTDIWEAFITGPDTIEFLAQDPSFDLLTGQDYFVNIFFDGATPTGFTGSWLTSFDPTPGGVPEPASFVLVGAGLVAFGVNRLRSRKTLA
jgi:hypothetical protein